MWSYQNLALPAKYDHIKVSQGSPLGFMYNLSAGSFVLFPCVYCGSPGLLTLVPSVYYATPDSLTLDPCV